MVGRHQALAGVHRALLHWFFSTSACPTGAHRPVTFKLVQHSDHAEIIKPRITDLLSR